MGLLEDIAIQIELHSVEGIRNCFSKGVGPNDLLRNKPLIYELISEYTRSPRFKNCVNTFIEHGLIFHDPVLLSVLADDAELLEKKIIADPEIISKKYSLSCAYTPLFEVTLLHICAEFNHVSCAKVLTNHGADINAAAGFDEHGFGGHSPIFHTVNQNSNQSSEMMEFLLAAKADLKITVPGLIWGKGYEWETLIPAVNPISYAQMGLLPQMHRDEKTIAKTVSVLMQHAYSIDYFPPNIPCAYLNMKKG